MFSALATIIGGAVGPVLKHYFPDPEKAQEAEMKITMAVMAQGSTIIKLAADNVKAEIASKHWLAANWRPISMLTFLFLVVCDSFNWLPNRLAPDMWDLLKIGMGGYVGGRTVEKVAPMIMGAFKKETV